MNEEYKLYKGAPDLNTPCELNERKVYEYLTGLGLDFLTLKHPAAFTMEECEAVRERIGAPVFKNLFLTNKQQTLFFLLLMPADKPFKTKYLSSQIGCARLSFASESDMKSMLGVKPGSVTPMGLIFDKENKVNVIIDKDLLSEETYACHPCVNSASVSMRLSDLLDNFLPSTNHSYKIVELPSE